LKNNYFNEIKRSYLKGGGGFSAGSVTAFLESLKVLRKVITYKKKKEILIYTAYIKDLTRILHSSLKYI
jgi:hypothetical protein